MWARGRTIIGSGARAVAIADNKKGTGGVGWPSLLGPELPRQRLSHPPHPVFRRVRIALGRLGRGVACRSPATICPRHSATKTHIRGVSVTFLLRTESQGVGSAPKLSILGHGRCI